MTFRLPTALERQGDFSQTTDNNGNPYPYIKDPQLPGACTAARSDRVLRGRRRARQDPGRPPLSTGPEHPQDVSAAEQPEHRRSAPTIIIQPTVREHRSLYQPALRSTISRRQSLRVSVQVLRQQQRQAASCNGSLPGLNDTQMRADPAQSARKRSRSTTHQPDDVPRGTYGRAGNQLAGCGPAPSFCERRGPDERRFQSEQRRPWRTCRCSFPDANVSTSDYYAYEHPQPQQAAVLGRHADSLVPASRGAAGRGGTNRHGTAPPNIIFPGFLNINTTQDVAISLTKVMRPPHAQDRLLQQPQPEAREQRPRRHELRDAQLRAGHRRHQPVRHVVRLRQRGDRQLQLLRPGVEVRRRRRSSTTTAKATCRTTGR